MTYDEQRTVKEKALDAAIVERVKRGIALLEEKHGPDFADHIDIAALDLMSPTMCVLGQLYDSAEPTPEQWDVYFASSVAFTETESGFSRGLAILDGGLLEEKGAAYYGFSDHDDEWYALQAAWELLLADRQGRG